MNQFAIRVERLGKKYALTSEKRRHSTAREALSTTLTTMFERLRPGAAPASRISDFWALREVSFDVKPGETVGLIGANGSGKSTLLKIISQIVAPTKGTVEIRGRVGALLEVGTGFHPELTGRDNIFLNGSILGMTRTDIRSRFDSIVDFAGVERFLDLPIKRYSSGMTLRLAFAVAAHLEPDVLIIDEVLAVGDAEFQRKCLDRMDVVARSGCTVLFVSHNLTAVQRLCSRAILLKDGRIAVDGTTRGVVTEYLANVNQFANPGEWKKLTSRGLKRGLGQATILAVRIGSQSETHGYAAYSLGPLEVSVMINATTHVRAAQLTLTIYDQFGTSLVVANSRTNGESVELQEGSSVWRITVDCLYLKPGRYLVDIWLGDTVGKTLDASGTALQLEVVGRDGSVMGLLDDPHSTGLVPCSFEVSKDDEICDHRHTNERIS